MDARDFTPGLTPSGFIPDPDGCPQSPAPGPDAVGQDQFFAFVAAAAVTREALAAVTAERDALAIQLRQVTEDKDHLVRRLHVAEEVSRNLRPMLKSIEQGCKDVATRALRVAGKLERPIANTSGTPPDAETLANDKDQPA